MRRHILCIYVQFLNQSETEDLRVEFEQIDKDHSGYISIEELAEALNASNGAVDRSDEVERIMKNLDYDKNDQINYTEFLAATITIDKDMITKERRDAIFKQFDIENKDRITPNDIKMAFNKMSKSI